MFDGEASSYLLGGRAKYHSQVLFDGEASSYLLGGREIYHSRTVMGHSTPIKRYFLLPRETYLGRWKSIVAKNKLTILINAAV
jgi:hypothetical protein